MKQGFVRQAAELIAKYVLLEARLKIETIKERQASIIKGAVLMLASGIFWINGIFILNSSLFFHLAGFADLVIPALWSAGANVAIAAVLLLVGIKTASA